MANYASAELKESLCKKMESAIIDFGKDLDEIFSYYQLLRDNPNIGSQEDREVVFTMMDALSASEMSMIEIWTYIKAEMTASDLTIRQVLMLNLERSIADYLLSIFGYITEGREDTIWKRYSVTHNVPEDLYQELITKSDAILGNNDFWKKRNVSTHFDFNIKKVHTAYISENDEDEIIRFAIEVWDIILPVYLSASCYWKAAKPIKKLESKPDVNNYIDEVFCKNTNCQKAINEIVTTQVNRTSESAKLSIRFDGFTTLLRKKKILQQEYHLIVNLNQSIKSFALGDFLLLEYAGAMQSTFATSSSWERRVCMKRTYSIAYEAFEKIIGFDDKSKEVSCLAGLERFINSINDNKFVIEVNNIKLEINNIIARFGFDDEKRREVFTHPRYEDRVLVLEQYLAMKKIRIMDIMASSAMIVRVINRLKSLILNVMSAYSTILEESNNARWSRMFDNIRKNTTDATMIKHSDDFEKQLRKAIDSILGI